MEHSLITELLLGSILLLMAAAILIDLKSHRIPNLICIAFICIGISVQVFMNSWFGLIIATGGIVTGLILFLPFYLYKGMAAGDVKLLASIGALLGPQDIFFAALYTLVIGACLAIIILLVKAFFIAGWRTVAEVVRSYFQSLYLMILSRSLIKPEPQAAALRNIRFPYALAISAGCSVVLVQQSLFNFFHLKALLVNQLGIVGGLL